MRVFSFDRYIFRMKFPQWLYISKFTRRREVSLRYHGSCTVFVWNGSYWSFTLPIVLCSWFVVDYGMVSQFFATCNVVRNNTRLHPFARSRLYNATAVRSALWRVRQSHSVNYVAMLQTTGTLVIAKESYRKLRNHQHSPFARRQHDFRQAAARRFKLHFPRYRLVKVSWKSVQPFPRTVVS